MDPSAELHFPADLGFRGLLPSARPPESPQPPALVRWERGRSLTFCWAASSLVTPGPWRQPAGLEIQGTARAWDGRLCGRIRGRAHSAKGVVLGRPCLWGCPSRG